MENVNGFYSRHSFADILTSHNIPLPPKAIISARWKARFNDWYVLTEDGWFWFDSSDDLWKICKEPD